MREIKVTQYIEYDSDRDRSEEFGWSKVCNERVPTEQEQSAWATYTLWTVVALCLIALFAFTDKPLW